MSFTITRKLEQVPSYQMLSKLAEQNHLSLTDNERNGSFSCRGMQRDYEFGAGGIHGKFGGHGVTGEFCLEIGRVTLTSNDKPFWLPTILLKQNITKGLDAFCTGLAQRPPRE